MRKYKTGKFLLFCMVGSNLLRVSFLFLVKRVSGQFFKESILNYLLFRKKPKIAQTLFINQSFRK